MQAIQAAAEMEVKLKKAEDRVDDLESQLIEKVGGGCAFLRIDLARFFLPSLGL